MRLVCKKVKVYNPIKVRYLSTYDIRHKFLNYFQTNDHKVVSGSSLIPNVEDKSLLFTNAGMNQFKPYFLRPALAPYPNLASTQLCLRAGGKHNDLDNVGHTNRHLTTFEMLGNFSFASLQPMQAIQLAYNFLTQELGLDRSRLLVTVLEGDIETYNLWLKLGLDRTRIKYCGSQDNFWTMGNLEPNSKLKLPCGPCTEIFYDMFPADHLLDFDTKFVELWNLVFMQYLMDSKNELTRLQSPCIDTGMGLERLAAALQGKTNNFEIDIFRAIIDRIDDFRANTSDTASSLAYKRIIADHLRTVSFLILEGIRPGPNGRDYVLRRILRRALRSCHQLHCAPNTLTQLLPTLATTIDSKVFPNFNESLSQIELVINREEVGFANALAKGSAILEDFFQKNQASKVLEGSLAFLLYDRHGFPIDLTQSIANDQGFQVDFQGFQKLLETQRLSSKSNQFSVTQTISTNELFKDLRTGRFEQSFVGYGSTTGPTHSTLKAVEVSDSGTFVVVEPNPFYCYGGGQEPDLGTIELPNGSKIAIDQASNLDGIVALKISADSNQLDQLRPGVPVLCQVDLARRDGLTIHHSATHLINLALRTLYGSTIKQAGSNVYPNKLRFDFNTDFAIDIPRVEDWVNHYIVDAKLHGSRFTATQLLPMEQALAAGALKTELEKYPHTVRVVTLGPNSKELCTGTHVHDLTECFPIRILSCTSIASGIRRIEAVASQHAYHHQQAYQAKVERTLTNLKVSTLDQLGEKFTKLMAKQKELKQQLTSSKPGAEFQVEATLFAGADGQPVPGNWIQLTAADLHLNEDEVIPDATKYAKMLQLVDTINTKLASSVNLIQFTNLLLLTQPQTALQPIDCNQLLKSWLLKGAFGKGGGNKHLVRAKLDTEVATFKKVVLHKGGA